MEEDNLLQPAASIALIALIVSPQETESRNQTFPLELYSMYILLLFLFLYEWVLSVEPALRVHKKISIFVLSHAHNHKN